MPDRRCGRQVLAPVFRAWSVTVSDEPARPRSGALDAEIGGPARFRSDLGRRFGGDDHRMVVDQRTQRAHERMANASSNSGPSLPNPKSSAHARRLREHARRPLGRGQPRPRRQSSMVRSKPGDDVRNFTRTSAKPASRHARMKSSTRISCSSTPKSRIAAVATGASA